MLANDISRCMGEKNHPAIKTQFCTRRESCARYIERNTGGERTPHHPYLCGEGDMYIPAEKPNDH